MGENSVLGGGGMGPADVAAVMRGNYGNGYGDGWGGSWLWVIVLFAIMMFGGGWGNNGFQNAMAGVVRYPMSTAYNAGFNPFCNCGNMCMGMAA